MMSFLALGGFYLGSNYYVSLIYNKSHTKAEVSQFMATIQEAISNDLELIIEDDTRIVTKEELEDWTNKYIREYSGKEDIRFSPQKIQDYLESLAPHINIEPTNAELKFESNRASVFVPSVDGKKLDINGSTKVIIDSLLSNSVSVKLLIDPNEAEISLDKINNLGINTLLSKGSSNFAGSPASRVHNIKIGAAKYNGIILKPGEEFSFNNLLGNVDAKNGYESELVIKGGGLVYEYGGGICQVSTTVFRAAIEAGFPITERRPHSFPVRYYNPQGYDATIYPGVVDLKFINDTPAHILVQSIINGNNISIEIYGSDDGREVIVGKPAYSDQKSNGAMKAYFMRTISYKDGEPKEEKFNSKYGAPVGLARNPLE
jgi:vancomycin resistance protein YoaR